MDSISERAQSSGRASSETITGSSTANESLEKALLMSEGSISREKRSKSFWRRHLPVACCHLAIFLGYSIVALLALDSQSKKSQKSSEDVIYSPANSILRWDSHRFNSGDGHAGPYSGYPRPELDAAWEELLGNMNVRFSLEDMQAVDRVEDAVQLPDGSGYVGTLNVYHEIHCVKWMHTYMYQEHYYPNLDDAQREENRLHSEHCLNHLRKSAICHGDVGMVTYRWGNDSRKPYASATSHKCVDFDALTQWTNERTVNLFKPGYLIHPTLGPAYHEGEKKGLME